MANAAPVCAGWLQVGKCQSGVDFATATYKCPISPRSQWTEHDEAAARTGFSLDTLQVPLHSSQYVYSCIGCTFIYSSKLVEALLYVAEFSEKPPVVTVDACCTLLRVVTGIDGASTLVAPTVTVYSRQP